MNIEEMLADTKRAIAQMNKIVCKDEPKLWLASYTLWVCPICGDSEVANYAGVKFVKKHRHPISRYFTGHASYGKWLKQYYEDLHRLIEDQKGKK